MSPHPRRELPDESRAYRIAFARRLRRLMDDAKLDSHRVAERLTQAGCKVGHKTVNKWLRGDSTPEGRFVYALGPILGYRDARFVWPDPSEVDPADDS